MTISERFDKLLSKWLNQGDSRSDYHKEEKAKVENIKVFEDNKGQLFSYKEKKIQRRKRK
jgi:hypothetical protein